MLLKSILVIITISYPFIVYFGLNRFEPSVVLYFLVVLLALRWRIEKQSSMRKVLIFSALAILVIAYFIGDLEGLKMYPVTVNLAMLILFSSSLYAKQSIVEKLARLKEPDLPPEAVAYTRKVTQVWCAFFAINGSIAFFTALWTSNETWLFYNGFLAYILIGTLVSGEWLIRYRVKRRL
ncbi:hypothetical protein [Marinomonas transparens]|uniref:DNA gyrase subunit B n=1 Tax=Marinomonas transparens TaxID=2795388 RepID=A0A934N2F4_9GAMM|nr:hypothetical protein [Marinomonas transparens]MBJ7538702.1 hypothetical protein [Marinomonas transparens]